jgi:hypothetical protein
MADEGINARSQKPRKKLGRFSRGKLEKSLNETGDSIRNGDLQ